MPSSIRPPSPVRPCRGRRTRHPQVYAADPLEWVAYVRTTRVGPDTTFGRVVKMVEEAKPIAPTCSALPTSSPATTCPSSPALPC